MSAGARVDSDGHNHATAPRRALAIALALTVTFIAVEIVGGVLSNSLALLADAGHMISDAGAIALSLFAMWIANRRHTARRTFGLHRAEILAALANGATLWLIAGYVIFEAVRRAADPPEIASLPMLVVAILGLIVNLAAMWVLGHHRDSSLNVRGAYLHVAGDALGSVGVIAAAAIIWFTGWTMADAIVSLVISALIIFAGWRLIRETVSILLEISPGHVDVQQLGADIRAVPGVAGVHELHVWTVTSGFISLSAHAELSPGADADDVLRRATDMLHDDYGIHHVTIQPETPGLHDGQQTWCLEEHESHSEPAAGVAPRNS